MYPFEREECMHIFWGFRAILDLFVLEIVPRLPQEQANTISNRNRIKLVFKVLV